MRDCSFLQHHETVFRSDATSDHFLPSSFCETLSCRDAIGLLWTAQQHVIPCLKQPWNSNMAMVLTVGPFGTKLQILFAPHMSTSDAALGIERRRRKSSHGLWGPRSRWKNRVPNMPTGLEFVGGGPVGEDWWRNLLFKITVSIFHIDWCGRRMWANLC